MAELTCPKCGKRYYGVGCPDCDYPARLPDKSEARRRRLMGILLLVFSVLVTFSFFTKNLPFADRWPLIIVTVIFALAGVQFIVVTKGRVSALMGGLIYFGFSVLGLFVAIGLGRVEGGIPFIPDTWNQTFGKLVFGIIACFTAVMSFYCFRRVQKNSDKK